MQGKDIMKQRILTAAVALIILVCVLFWLHTPVFNVAIALIGVMAAYELLLATKYVENSLLSGVSLVFVAIAPFLYTNVPAPIRNAVLLAFVILLFIILLLRHQTLRIEQIGLVFMVSTLIPFSLSTLIYVRDAFPEHALFYILLTLAGAWIGDSGAYFVGSFFGKTKLAPEISPKKTVEGLIGGIATNILVFLLLGYFYSFYQSSLGIVIDVSYPMIALLAVICAFLGVLGDLSASIIKRQCSIKDFGSIMPGHGGILDRFDSVLFVAPFMYITLRIVSILS